MSDSDILTAPIISLDEVIGAEAACATLQEPGCTQRVEWLAVERCCGKQTLVCDYHKRRAEETTERKLKIHYALTCFFCGSFPSDREYISV